MAGTAIKVNKGPKCTFDKMQNVRIHVFKILRVKCTFVIIPGDKVYFPLQFI